MTKDKGDALPNDSISPEASLTIHPIQAQESLLVKIQPPTNPQRQINHVAVDIVLVIDISGSMGARADVPGEDDSESPGLSVLDLVKHATMTIIESLNEGDRLGVVTFCSRSRVVQELTRMTDENKKATRDRIRGIGRLDSTNMWHGMLDGLKLFEKGGLSERVPSMMVLTDGMPNHM